MTEQGEAASPFRAETIVLDLPALAGAFGQRLHRAGVPSTAEQGVRFAQALALVKPISRRRLYWTARAVFVSDQSQLRGFNAAFSAVFGAGGEQADAPELAGADRHPAPPDERPLDPGQPPHEGGEGSPPGVPSSSPGAGEDEEAREIAIPMAASDDELLREKRFDALEASELAQLYRLMAQLQIVTPERRTRRSRSEHHGERIDMRRTLRGSLRTAGDPIRLARRRRRIVRRRIVLLCDISGSMEPYARAYLQFLTCAVGAGRGAEAFVFATRLTRLTRALRSRSPERAIQRAAAAAPDWSSGTRIGDALKSFNDHHGRRGMARGAVIVILSDGWERGDPTLVGRELERMRLLAYRIVWVNPRVSAEGFAPKAGGMAAALPHCDALVSGHSLEALEQVTEAIGADRARDLLPSASWKPPMPQPAEADEEEPWGSATPVPGSSVAMPSGYGPSRGNTTPGWGPDRKGGSSSDR